MSTSRRATTETAAAILCGALATAAVVWVAHDGSATGRRMRDTVAALTGGDAGRGAAAIARAGCGGCHAIPGIAGARGRVGPDLAGIGGRAFIGGVAANTPENMVRWLRDPRALSPRTAMPELGLDEPAARDIAAYLYLRGG